ncbi:MAG TPA: RNA polymerase sigma factor [Bacilli bacterium]
MVNLEKAFQALKKGDEAAFADIYEATHRLVYYTIYQILKNKELAEDIMQDTFLKVYEKIDAYRADSPKAWIVTIARNLAINEYNRRKKVSLLDDETLDYITEKENKDTPLIELAAKNLPEDEFMILMLCVCERYKRREVAKIMKLSTSGVTWKLNRALEKLKNLAKEVE